jgi:hypothetical protein
MIKHGAYLRWTTSAPFAVWPDFIRCQILGDSGYTPKFQRSPRHLKGLLSVTKVTEHHETCFGLPEMCVCVRPMLSMLGLAEL